METPFDQSASALLSLAGTDVSHLSNWAVTGSFACAIHLEDDGTLGIFREPKDVDVYSFDPILWGINIPNWEVCQIHGGKPQVLDFFDPPSTASTFIDIWHNWHFDNLIPRKSDIVVKRWMDQDIPLVSKEFLIAFKAFAVLWNDRKHISDARILLGSGIADSDYLDRLMRIGPFGRFIHKNDDAIAIINSDELLSELSHRIQTTLPPLPAEIVALPADMFNGFATTNSEDHQWADWNQLTGFVERNRIEEFSVEEQALALYHAVFKSYTLSDRTLLVIQNCLIDSATRWRRQIDRKLYFLHATWWGRYMQRFHSLDTEEMWRSRCEYYSTTVTTGRFLLQLQQV